MDENVTDVTDEVVVVFANGVQADTPAGMITPLFHKV
jgi:hypothetical protein